MQSRKIDVIVVWKEWESLSSEARSDIIMTAYGDQTNRVALALGVTHRKPSISRCCRTRLSHLFGAMKGMHRSLTYNMQWPRKAISRWLKTPSSYDPQRWNWPATPTAVSPRKCQMGSGGSQPAPAPRTGKIPPLIRSLFGRDRTFATASAELAHPFPRLDQMNNAQFARSATRPTRWCSAHTSVERFQWQRW